jgi:pimeloyl-ACP methyl ester carboxylesterase
MPKAKVGDIQLYYEEHGQGEPLLLIMGLGASTLSWSEQIPTFSREFRVIAFDSRGAGRSDKPAVRYTIALFADDTAGLMDALGVDSAHVYGQSMGGFIAQEVALRHPQRVRTLVLASTSCGGHHAVAASPENLAGIGMMNVLTPREAAEKGLPLLYSDEFIASHHDALIERSLRESELRTPPDAFARQVQAAIRHNTFDRLPDIRCPTLVITGSNDKVVPEDNSRILAERIPGAELAVLPGAGHGYLVEKAAESNAIVLEFLRRHRRSATGPAASGSAPG